MLEFELPERAASWLRSLVTGTLQTDSRQVRPGDGFIAWPGAVYDARHHVAAALAAGAVACLVEREGAQQFGLAGPQTGSYAGLKAASGAIAAAYFGQPSEQLAVLAVTGTNGKTSSVWWLAQALSTMKDVAPIPCAMVGTLGIGNPPAPGSGEAAGGDCAALVATGLTTPDPVLLQKTFRQLVDSGMQACAIEASSIGIEESRLSGTRIRTAVFTNFTQDHLDYHGSMAAYWAAKARLFQWPGLQSAVINIDDAQGAGLAQELGARVPDIWSISCRGPARLRANGICHDARGLRFTVREGGTGIELQTKLIGSYNVSNLLGVMATMRSLGVPLLQAVASCADLTPVPGRMECLGAAGQPLVAVDYAHTPDALAKALLALRPLADQRGGKLWCVFGCGGDRDAGKRPVMGAIAASHADRVVLTSDNPRSEKMDVIISQILLGLTGHAAAEVESDRARAIADALAQAAPADVLLIAGKGHEDYQEVAGQRRHFSDREEVQRALALRSPAPLQNEARDV